MSTTESILKNFQGIIYYIKTITLQGTTLAIHNYTWHTITTFTETA